MKSLYNFCTFLLLVMIIAACRPVKPHVSEPRPYSEPHRPQFHFSPDTGWMNDPNGLVYDAGVYHLFYQYYPDSTVWGPMHWGHATSTDLVHWTSLPIALFPDSLGYIFSGSAVIDADNTSGFGTNGIAPLVAIYTSHDMAGEKAGRINIESQSIAYSLDHGNTWTKYAGNPVVPNPGVRNFRDPKVFWHAASARWIMPIAAGDHLDFYKSPDLKHWEKAGEFGQGYGAHGGVWECPDLFPLKTDHGSEKWILIQNMDRGAVNGGSGTQYFVGTFDGNTFHDDNPPATTLWLDYGADDYAGVTWFGAPGGRRLFIGWMSQWYDYAQKVPTAPWRSAMTVPRVLSLDSLDIGYRVLQQPVKELERLRLDTTIVSSQRVTDSLVLSKNASLEELTLSFDISRTTASQFGFRLSNDLGEQVLVGYTMVDSMVFIDRTRAGISAFSKLFARRDVAPYVPGSTLRMHALVDVASVELFVDDGRVVMTEIFFPHKDFTHASVFADDGAAANVKATVYRLKSIWNKE